MRVYLLRHGETDWNVARRLQGTMNTPLNANGIRQSERWRPYFDRLHFAGIYTSALDRAVHTAWLATGRPACIIEGFNERGFGQWEGQSWPDLEKTVSEFDLRWSDNNFRPPDGESRLHLFDRVKVALQHTVYEHQATDDLLIVAHGASGHAILSALLHHPIEDRGSLPVLTNASLTIVEVQPDRAILIGQVVPDELAE